MYTLVYDGTFEGLLTAVFEIYDRKLFHVKLIKGEWRSSAMFEEVLQVITDERRATRVLKGLRKKLSAAGIQRLYIAHMAEMDNEENAIVGFIRYVFDTDVNIEEDYGNKYVMRLSEILKMVRREKHRMEAFIRFRKLKDGIYYAAVEPDFNVLPLLIRHFKNRYTDQKWIIYDIKRRYGIHYDLHDTQYITLDFSEVNKSSEVENIFTDDEQVYQQLWKSYFTNVNIVARKNTKLHLRHIPKRYWRHLTEKI
ncbi:TIGR03915 family putative DNA repair protein [Mucilaginibacter ginsenosidivorax]|uniref:DNA metabolism protein n=1 Tax=Mucilaginibacter ginsenosidivorax TaxID=862126 RepID=A0A5B8W8F1_9SPHI|nr:TIGR03915 family putative DNA repair protein [Mucilaginibacter ginsenosidivorax]QEC80194.1 DNA metabolism protein [Mucilaginibacter ginsenosidivorax]